MALFNAVLHSIEKYFFQHATLKNWYWPGYEATTVHRNAHGVHLIEDHYIPEADSIHTRVSFRIFVKRGQT